MKEDQWEIDGWYCMCSHVFFLFVDTGQLCVNEMAIFPFTKTPPTINFKLLPTSRWAPLSGQLIDNTRHHSPAIHSTYVTTYYISKGYHSDPRLPWMYHCSKHHCLAIPELHRQHWVSSRLPLLSYETIGDKGGSGQQWRSNRGRSCGMYGDLTTKGMELWQDPGHSAGNQTSLEKKVFGCSLHFNSKMLLGDSPWQLPSV